MRRYSKISGLTIVTCNAVGCEPSIDRGTEFRSASDPKLIDRQLEGAGWTVLEVRDPRTADKRIHELCPQHRPRSRMEGGPPPLAVMGRRSH